MASVHNSRQFPGVPVSDSFPKDATVYVGGTDSNVIVEVATAAPDTTERKPIDSFTTSKTDVWSFGANTMAANLAALAGLSKFLETEVQSLNKPKWAANIEALAKTLDQAVQQSNQLCNDTNATLTAPSS